MFAILRHAFHHFAFRIADHARNKQAFKTWKSTELRRSGYPLHISRCFACKSVRWLDKPQPQLGCSLEVTPQELSFQHHRWRWSWSQGYWKGKAHCLSLASPSQSITCITCLHALACYPSVSFTSWEEERRAAVTVVCEPLENAEILIAGNTCIHRLSLFRILSLLSFSSWMSLLKYSKHLHFSGLCVPQFQPHFMLFSCSQNKAALNHLCSKDTSYCLDSFWIWQFIERLFHVKMAGVKLTALRYWWKCIFCFCITPAMCSFF